MIRRHLRKRMSCICLVVSEFCHPRILPDVYEVSLNFGSIQSLNMRKNRSFYGTGAACFAKTPEHLSSRRKLDIHCAECGAASANSEKRHVFYGTRAALVDDLHTTGRISRVARTEAEDALLEYLNQTRGLQFTDAERISRNSPLFLQNLLSKVGDEEDVKRSMRRFLRYHPINEFEAFFESLGLRPSEFLPLLPRNMMFLSDDDLLLDNYNVLCNYGIPRSKIGKIYKEATETFMTECGVLSSKLRAYEELGLSKSMIIKMVMCCPLLLVGGVNKVLIRVLEELKCLGIEYDWVGEHLSDKNTYHWNRILETLGFLNEMGCSKINFAKLLKNHPDFFFDDSGKKIYVLAVLLLKLGLNMNEILFLLLRYPKVLAGNFSKYLWRTIRFMSELGMKPEDIAKIVRTHFHVLSTCTRLMKPRALLS